MHPPSLLSPRRASLLAGLLLIPAATHQAAAQGILFSDNFDTDTSALWNVFEGSASGVPDFTAQFNFDYSTHGIPSAPGSAGGTTRGVKLTVNNNDDVPETSAAVIFPKDQSFSGNYAVRFWMWINYNGGPYGGTGSTEFGIQGINHAGDKVVWSSAPDRDGLFFAVTGEGGAAGDYRTFLGIPGGPFIRQTGIESGILDRDANGAPDQEAVGTNPATSPLRSVFPSPPFETPEVPGKQWVLGELRQYNGFVTWSLNGWVIAELDSASLATTSGNFMLGTMDIFASIADPRADNFVIYDNVSVVNLDVEAPLPRLSVIATDASFAEPGTDTATVTFSRTGATTSPLTVHYSFLGTATPGVDFATNSLTSVGPNLYAVTIPAGASSADVVFTALDDALGEPDETLLVTAAGIPGSYEVGLDYRATLTLVDDGDLTTVNIEVVDGQTYERDAEDTLTFRVTRAGFTGDDLTVNLSYGGTASASDYSGAIASVVIPALETSATIVLAPVDDALVEGTEEIIVTVASGTGYVVGLSASGTGTVRDDDRAAGTVLFSENFDTDVSANWTALFGSGNGVTDFSAQFGYDYALDGLPPAPGSSGTTGLRVTVNKDDLASAAAVNLYLRNQSFSGNFAVRFNMLLNYDTLAAGTTEHAIFGINHSGSITNRHATAGSDGLWFAVETDGSSQGGIAYATYLGQTNAVPVIAGRPSADFRTFFPTPLFIAGGMPSGRWADVELVFTNRVASMIVNGVTTATRSDIGSFTSGTIMLGHMDRFNSIGGLGNATYYDNLRVVDLGGSTTVPATQATLGLPAISGTQIAVPFTATTGTPDQFELVSSTTLTGAYTPVAGATISSTGAGAFSASAPLPAADATFFRVVTK